MSSGTITPVRTTSLLRWRADDGKTRLLGMALIVFLASMLGLTISAQLVKPIYGDFFAMWSFARFALTHPPAQIYDVDALHAFQLGLDPELKGNLPFPYPPTYLLSLLPVGLLPIAFAWALWSFGGLGAYLAAVLARSWNAVELLFVALAPATVMSVVSGQNGMLSGALLVGGVRLMERRPYVAGMLFGLMTFKPQLGLMIPVALAAAGLWRCVAAAAATSVLFAAAAAAAFGPSIWPVWIDALRHHWDNYVVTGNHTRARMPTVTAALQLLGVDAWAAQLAQLAVAVGAAALVWLIVRRRGTDPLAIAAVLVGTFLATPYSLFYDLPPVTFAVLLLVRQAFAGGGALGLLELLIVLFAFLMPYGELLVEAVPFPVKAPALLLLFGVIVRRALVRAAPVS